MRRIEPSAGRIAGAERPRDTPDGKTYHDAVVLVAFASLDEIEELLAMLAWFLAGISTLLCAIAALSARWLSRRTLVPLSRLVESARSVDAANPGWTLAEVGTGDELDDLRNAFNDLLTRLRRAYDRQRRFSSEASHQLRTPVAVMIGHLEVALRHERSGEEYRRVVERAHRRAVELGQIVESLLFLGREDSATLTRAETFDLGRWLLEYRQSRLDGPRSGDLTFRVMGEDPLWIRAQPLLLGQMLENLLDNACKYSRPGTPIVAAASRCGDSALLSIADSGCGITREDMPRIFEPFFRGSATTRERIPGVGLGLAVVGRIVRAFGGDVTVDSEPGRGSRFEVLLPLQCAPPTENEPGELPRQRPLAAPPALGSRAATGPPAGEGILYSDGDSRRRAHRGVE
jgi:signal transduction histidine kinase